MKYSKGEIAKMILKTAAVGTLVIGVAIIAPGIGPVLQMFMPKKSLNPKKIEVATEKKPIEKKDLPDSKVEAEIRKMDSGIKKGTAS